MGGFQGKMYHTIVASIYIVAGIAILVANYKDPLSLNYKIVAGIISCYGLFRLIRTWLIPRNQKH